MSIQRWRGLKDLVSSAVENGSLAIERVHKQTAERPFGILESIPPLRVPVAGIHEIHDTIVSDVHRVIRITNRMLSQTLDLALDAIEPEQEPGNEAHEER